MSSLLFFFDQIVIAEGRPERLADEQQVVVVGNGGRSPLIDDRDVCPRSSDWSRNLLSQPGNSRGIPA